MREVVILKKIKIEITKEWTIDEDDDVIAKMKGLEEIERLLDEDERNDFSYGINIEDVDELEKKMNDFEELQEKIFENIYEDEQGE